MKEISKAKAREILMRNCREAVHIEAPKLVLNQKTVKWTYLDYKGVVLAKGKDGKYYSDILSNESNRKS